MSTQTSFYNDFLYKKLKPKSEILENQLEDSEYPMQKINSITNVYNLSIPTQDDVWIHGRVFSENAGGGGGKLTEHNVVLQGTYFCSNSKSVPLNLANCKEFSLFPGQIVLAHGRNPDGKRFLCNQIIEPPYISDEELKKIKIKKEETIDINDTFHSRGNSINVKPDENQDINIVVASGPYMATGSTQTPVLNQLIEVVKSKNTQVLILLGPFVDSNHDLISTGNIQSSYEELLQTILDDIAQQLRHVNIQVVIQPSLNDVTQEPIYPVAPLNVSNQFMKQNEFFHFLQEPSMIEINGFKVAITTTDVIKDLTSIAASKTLSSDKISRNFSHLLRQRSFYPIYPPPDHVCIDFEAWNKYAKIECNPRILIAVSDLVTFNKEVNNCSCINPGRLVKGTSNGTYAQITISPNKHIETLAAVLPNLQHATHTVAVAFSKI